MEFTDIAEVADYTNDNSPWTINVPRADRFDSLLIIVDVTDAISGGAASGSRRDDGEYGMVTDVGLKTSDSEYIIEPGSLADLAHKFNCYNTGKWGGRDDVFNGNDRTHAFGGTQVRCAIRRRPDLADQDPWYVVSYHRDSSDDFAAVRTDKSVSLPEGEGLFLKDTLIRCVENGAKSDALIDTKLQIVSPFSGFGSVQIAGYNTWLDGTRHATSKFPIGNSRPTGVLPLDFDAEGQLAGVIDTSEGAYGAPELRYTVSAAPAGTSTIHVLTTAFQLTQAGAEEALKAAA